MIIDFHTHVFPDKIAVKTVELLAEKGGIPPFSDGTVSALLDRMEEAGVDISVNLPVITNPAQFYGVNKFASEINAAFADKQKRLISFAGIHPLCEDLEGKMEWIAENGFLGVKIHPDYQHTFIDDKSYVRILKAAKKHDLIVITHSGVDAYYRNHEVRCTPERVKRVIDEVGHKKFVLAHYGANEYFDQVYDILCGTDVYFDTAYNLRFIGRETFIKILRKHGEDKILFASDSPWSSIKNDVEILRSFSLDKNTEEKIFCENAVKLLGI